MNTRRDVEVNTYGLTESSELDVVQFFGSKTDGEWNFIKAEVEVEDLGKVEIKNCLSSQTLKEIDREVKAATRLKLGIVAERGG